MGTQGTKALLWERETGEVLGRGSVGYSLTSTRPGQAEQQPHTWLEVRCRGGASCLLCAALLMPSLAPQTQLAAATGLLYSCQSTGLMMPCVFPTQSGAGQMDALPLMNATGTPMSLVPTESLATPITFPPHVHRPARRPSQTPWTMPPAWALAATPWILGRGGSRWLLVCGPWA